MPPYSKKKMISNDKAEGNGMAVMVSLYHDGVDEGNLDLLPKFKKKMISNDSF